MCKEFFVIGIPDNDEPVRDERTARLIQTNGLFSGGKRHHELLLPYLPEGHRWIDITVPLDDVFEQYAQADEPVVVFASGDPLFFGFANTIQRKLPEAKITVYPYFNSLQMLAHRLVMPYHDMHIVSLTGRPWHEFDAALIRRQPKIGVLTDGIHTPAAIARRMLDYGYTYYTMSVGERLGNPLQERITTLSLEEAASRNFERPNCVMLWMGAKIVGGTGAVGGARIHSASKSNLAPSTAPVPPTTPRPIPPTPHPIPDHLFALLDGREKMITKAPIRLLSLAALELHGKTSFWDVGFCTGSVSIEARLLFPQLHVTAFEVREEGRQLMETNSRRFGAPGITTIIGDFLAADVSACMPPDAVFIGGHGGQLDAIVSKAAQCLLPGGVLVYNCVSPDSVTDARIRTDSQQRFTECAAACGLQIEPPMHVAINDYHPIHILKARKT